MRRLSILLLALLPTVAQASWPVDGARVCAALGSQLVPSLCSDGQQGAFVVWGDRRESYMHTDVYLQHLNGAGEVAPGWPADGLLLAGGPGSQFPQGLIPDGMGGVLVLIRNQYAGDAGDLYLQRITTAGRIAPGWPAGGVPVAVAPGVQQAPAIASDGLGGAFLSWQDHRPPTYNVARMTHVLGNGTLAPGWPVEGRVIEPTTTLTMGRPLMLPVEGGGFLACWGEWDWPSSTIGTMRGQKYAADGTPAPDWPAQGVEVCSLLPMPRGPWDRLAGDGTGGFFTVWIDYRASPDYEETDLYVQHVLGTGTLAPSWPADGRPVAASPGVTQDVPSLCEDGLGGMYVAWMDYRAGYSQVFMHHLRPDGQPWPGWPADGLHVGAGLTWQSSPHVEPDGAGGVYVTWTDVAGNYRTFVQHLTAFGVPQAGWPANGLAVAATPHDQYVPVICSDGAGGAIVAWEDYRDPASYPDIYAQRFVRDGIVAAAVSLVSAEAAPGAVRLVWAVSGARAATLERRGAGGAWEPLAVLAADGEGRLAYTDSAVSPGATYEYRLALADGTYGGLARVEVPRAYTLTLEGARPNPARVVLQVAFTLPDAGAAQLALYDLAGRRLAAREVGGLGAGRHLARLTDAPLAPGLYWAVLAHGGRTLRARVAVTR